jgi:hypothetical protein
MNFKNYPDGKFDYSVVFDILDKLNEVETFLKSSQKELKVFRRELNKIVKIVNTSEPKKKEAASR